jgi:outer membrane cobalamin receptor
MNFYKSSTYPTLLISLATLLLLLVPDKSHAQFVPLSKKVHNIEKIEVVSNRNEFYGEDQKRTKIDTTILHYTSSSNLDELLSRATPVFIKSYGSSGSLAVPSLRGSSSNHTLLTWNGFPINSITLGQCDLSHSPTEFMDNVTVTHGASGSLYGSGTFGGNINMKNEVDWKTRDYLSISSEYGSWNNHRYNLEALVGNNSLKYKISGIYHQADNDFKFRDTQKFGNPIEVREHNSLKNYGLMQNLFYRFNPRNKLEAGVWYQQKEKKIPSLMGEYSTGTNAQKDSSLRAYVKWNSVFNNSSIQVKTGYFYNYQLYTEKESPEAESYSLYSPIFTRKWLNDANYRLYFSDHITFDFGSQYSLLSADVEAYNSTITEYRASLIAAMKLEYPRFVTNASVRQQFNNYTNPKPQFSLGLQYTLLPDILYLRSNFSTKYRIPTFNDKYWNPGGNEQIRPEHGWSGELGLQFSEQKAGSHSISAEVTGYASRVHDLIQWVPKAGEAYWHAINTSKVQTLGVESNMDLMIRLQSFDINFKSIYTYTHSLKKDEPDEALNNTFLRYTPRHSIKNFLHVKYSKYFLGSDAQYTGKRYTSEDNTSELPGYFTTNMFVGRDIQFKNIKGNIQFSVKNIFDNQYQVIANYPMPGRAYYIKLNVKFLNLF